MINISSAFPIYLLLLLQCTYNISVAKDFEDSTSLLNLQFKHFFREIFQEKDSFCDINKMHEYFSELRFFYRERANSKTIFIPYDQNTWTHHSWKEDFIWDLGYGTIEFPFFRKLLHRKTQKRASVPDRKSNKLEEKLSKFMVCAFRKNILTTLKSIYRLNSLRNLFQLNVFFHSFLRLY